MRVIATLTIDGVKEIRIEGDSAFLGGAPGDQLEQKGLGVWLYAWRIGSAHGSRGRKRKSRVFCPWGSVLYVEEVVNGAGKKIENKII